jgi:23S rRNA (cytosine1962-C5)-methyltransferase
MASPSMFAHRLQKNCRHRRKWAARQGLTAYRLYDRDMPEYPFAVDWYDGRVHVVEYPRRRGESRRDEVLAAVREIRGVSPDRIHLKVHEPKAWGREQYQPLGKSGERFVVEEQGLKFWVNLRDYLDTGLFLDHRLTRARVRVEAAGKRFLNLFGYTGSFTVYAAAGGAKSTTTVDLSNTYLDWAADNLALNGFKGAQHRFIRADAAQWVEEAGAKGERFDLIVLDPPSFSASKMARRFDVQKDHPRLLTATLALLSDGGTLYFSTNFQGFELDTARLTGSTIEELTPGSIPEDFHFKEIHRCWRIQPRR